jgi:H+-translocating NAD(P) transhydrogenase subunit beta
MTAMPQLVAAFHSLVGLAAVLVAAAALYAPEAFGIGDAGAIHGASLVEMSLGVAIGAITFTGSVIAFLKLDGRMSGKPIMLPSGTHQHRLGVAAGRADRLLVATESHGLFWLITLVALVLGVLIIIPIGGADMPVVVSMLNSYSGWAAAGIGFTLGNTRADHHRRAGRLVRRDPVLHHVQGHEPLLHLRHPRRLRRRDGAAAAARRAAAGQARLGRRRRLHHEERLKVIIVPGYGMAVAQAQHALREMADKLKKEGVEVKYAIHPVAGRMPGHMNVLLAEANVPYDEVFELEDINSEFAQADVAFVIGANDVTNPAAKTDKTSPIYGMPVLDVGRPARCCSSSARWARAMPASTTRCSSATTP